MRAFGESDDIKMEPFVDFPFDGCFKSEGNAIRSLVAWTAFIEKMDFMVGAWKTANFVAVTIYVENFCLEVGNV